jgi:hypothetical protein
MLTFGSLMVASCLDSAHLLGRLSLFSWVAGFVLPCWAVMFSLVGVVGFLGLFDCLVSLVDLV